MTRIPFTGVVVLLSLGVLSGCSSAPQHKPGDEQRSALYQLRSGMLSSIESWSLEGRLAVADGKEGGSGSFRWNRSEQASQMDFHGALGRGAWRLNADSHGALLELADGERYEAPTVNDLVSGRLGWSVPVDALAWWVRGLDAPGFDSTRSLDEEGRLSELSQLDWVVEFSRYRDVNGIMMPGKITARQADRSVKLAVRTWVLGSAAQP